MLGKESLCSKWKSYLVQNFNFTWFISLDFPARTSESWDCCWLRKIFLFSIVSVREMLHLEGRFSVGLFRLE